MINFASKPLPARFERASGEPRNVSAFRAPFYFRGSNDERHGNGGSIRPLPFSTACEEGSNGEQQQQRQGRRNVLFFPIKRQRLQTLQPDISTGRNYRTFLKAVDSGTQIHCENRILLVSSTLCDRYQRNQYQEVHPNRQYRVPGIRRAWNVIGLFAFF